MNHSNEKTGNFSNNLKNDNNNSYNDKIPTFPHNINNTVSTKALTGTVQNSTLFKEQINLKSLVSNLNSVMSTDWNTLQTFHESV